MTSQKTGEAPFTLSSTGIFPTARPGQALSVQAFHHLRSFKISSIRDLGKGK